MREKSNIIVEATGTTNKVVLDMYILYAGEK